MEIPNIITFDQWMNGHISVKTDHDTYLNTYLVVSSQPVKASVCETCMHSKLQIITPISSHFTGLTISLQAV